MMVKKNIVFDIGRVLVDYDWEKAIWIRSFSPEVRPGSSGISEQGTGRAGIGARLRKSKGPVLSRKHRRWRQRSVRLGPCV